MHKKIIIPPNTAIIDWIDKNRSEVYDALYQDIFDFVKSDLDRKIVLEIIMKTNLEIEDAKYQGISMDFVVTKDSIGETLDRLISHYEDYEEYEKCAELVKIKP
jgi:hypothetical protein